MATEALSDPDEESANDVMAASVRDAYTGEFIRTNDPDKYTAIISLLARGIAKSVIARDMHAHYYTVSNIEADHFPDVVRAKQLLSKKLFSAVTASIDSAERRAANGKANALDAKLLTEAWLNINGEASSIIEVNHSFAALDEFERPPVRDVTPAEARLV